MRQERVAPDEDLVFEAKNGRKYHLPRGVSSQYQVQFLKVKEEKRAGLHQ